MPPLAVIVTDIPLHIVSLFGNKEMEMFGLELTVIGKYAVSGQPAMLVPIRVYVVDEAGLAMVFAQVGQLNPVEGFHE